LDSNVAVADAKVGTTKHAKIYITIPERKLSFARIGKWKGKEKLTDSTLLKVVLLMH
jgi:hypothetical protein